MNIKRLFQRSGRDKPSVNEIDMLSKLVLISMRVGITPKDFALDMFDKAKEINAYLLEVSMYMVDRFTEGVRGAEEIETAMKLRNQVEKLKVETEKITE